MSREDIVFWPAAGAQTGLGHFYRCLALIKGMRSTVRCSFFLADSDTRVEEILCSEGVRYRSAGSHDFLTVLCEMSPAILVIDNPLLPADTVVSIRRNMVDLEVAVLSDQAPAASNADIVFEPHIVSEWRLPKEAAVRELYTGPDYWVLHPSFDHWLARKREVKQNAARILVTMGGSDFASTTLPAAQLVLSSVPQARVDMVCGPLFRETDEAAKLSRSSGGRLSVFCAPRNLPELMWSADVTVTAAGFSAYEFAALGVPMILWPVVDHQHFTAHALARKGCSISADRETLPHIISSLAADPVARRKMSRAGRLLVDGLGRERVLEILLRSLSRRSPDTVGYGIDLRS